MKIIENDGLDDILSEIQEKKFSAPEDAEQERMKTDEGDNSFFKNFKNTDEKKDHFGQEIELDDIEDTDDTNDIDEIDDTENDETDSEDLDTDDILICEENDSKTEDDISLDNDDETSELEFEDISSNSESDDTDDDTEDTDDDDDTDDDKEEKKMNFVVSLWKNKRRRAKLAYAIVCFVMVVVGAAYGFVNAILDKVEDETPVDTPVVDEAENKDIVYEEEDFDLFSAVSSAGSLNDYVKQWYYAGEPMQSKNVINVLLLGLDSKNGLSEGGRSDTMMLVSLNTKTKKIHMVSFFRDSWVYFKTSSGGEYYNKMNASYFYGKTAKCTVETIENIFKIKIDHYVVTDFKSFQNLVDAVGGVRVDVQEYEANNMMREWQLECPVGENVLLNGKQAFYFARQRHSDADADVSRTRRQRQVIMAFIDSCKGASISQLTDMLNKVFKYFQTDMTKTEILGYATRALANGWLSYDIEQITITDPDVFKTPTINGMSIVVQDYPKVAQIVQNEIYGSSNVVLEDNRISIFNLYR